MNRERQLRKNKFLGIKVVVVGHLRSGKVFGSDRQKGRAPQALPSTRLRDLHVR